MAFYLLKRLIATIPVMLVVAVFILALPFRGLSGLFGEFSAAGTLMAVALAGASLIAAAVDSSEAEAAKSRLMQLATIAFAATRGSTNKCCSCKLIACVWSVQKSW